MDVRQLRYFQAIYEHGSLLAASSHVRIATTALGYHLAKLEAEVGRPLFDRKPRGLDPTAAGERLHDHATRILRAIDEAVSDVRAGDGDIAGAIAVGMAYSAVKAVGVRLAKRMMADHPRLQLTLNESLSGVTLSHLMRSEVDLALVYNPPKDSRFRARPILSERMMCVGRADLIGPPGEPITVAEMLTLPIILLRQGVSSGAVLREAGLLKRIESAAVLRMNSVQAISGSLRERLGCTITTRLSVSGPVADGTLSCRPIVEPELSRALHVCELTERPQTYAIETVRAALVSLIREAVTSGEWEADLIDA